MLDSSYHKVSCYNASTSLSGEAASTRVLGNCGSRSERWILTAIPKRQGKERVKSGNLDIWKVN